MKPAAKASDALPEVFDSFPEVPPSDREGEAEKIVDSYSSVASDFVIELVSI